MAEARPITLGSAVRALGLGECVPARDSDVEVTGAIVSDLLSYVMAEGKAGYLWVTIQTHANIVAVAALTGIAGIVIASGLEPGEDTVLRAEEEGIAIYVTSEPAYAVAGKLYLHGLR